MRKLLAVLATALLAVPASAAEYHLRLHPVLPGKGGFVLLPMGTMPLFQVGTTAPGHTVGGGGGTVSGSFTSTRVPFASGASTLTDDSDMTFATDTLTVTKIAATTFTGNNVATGTNTFGTAVDAANTVRLGETAGAIVGEGATADAFETTLAFGDATADNTLSFTGTATGVTLSATTGSTQFVDNKLLICDDGDFTKCAAFQISGVATATTRTFTVPNASDTLAVLGTTQTFTARQFITTDNELVFGVNSGGGYDSISTQSAQTPDTGGLWTGTLGNSWIVGEYADRTFDFGHAIATNPFVWFHTKNQVATEYNGIGAVGSAAGLFKTLTESSATAVVQIPVASGAAAGGIFEYGVFATDNTDHQLRESSIRYSIVNKGGTETCSLSGLAGANDASITETEDGNANAISSGTLTYAIACDTAPTNAVNITINAVSSLTQTTLQVRYQVRHLGPGEPLPQ